MGQMKLEDYAQSGKYLKWSETDVHDISLNISYDEFLQLEPIFSDNYGSDQYELPIVCVDKEPFYESVLATKSKNLLVGLINAWSQDDRKVLRIKKSGSGFHTRWTIQESDMYYDKASAKVKRLPTKKS
jgi:hypothetical protein